MKKYIFEEKINVWYDVIKVNKFIMKRDVYMLYWSIFLIILVFLGLMIWLDVIIVRFEMNVFNIILLVVVNVLFLFIISLLFWFIVIKVYLYKIIIVIDKDDEIKVKYWVRKYVKVGCKKYLYSYIDYLS